MSRGYGGSSERYPLVVDEETLVDANALGGGHTDVDVEQHTDVFTAAIAALTAAR